VGALRPGNLRHEIADIVTLSQVRLSLDGVSGGGQFSLDERRGRFQCLRRANMTWPDQSSQPIDMPAKICDKRMLRILHATLMGCLQNDPEPLPVRGQFKWRGQDLNLRPRGYEPRELPDCSTPRHF